MLLAEKRLVFGFDKVLDAFSKEYDESRGIIRVEAVTAVLMTEKQRAALTAMLAAKLSGRIILTNTVDPSTLGGVKLRYLGKQLDGTVKTRLDGFAETLKTTVL